MSVPSSKKRSLDTNCPSMQFKRLRVSSETLTPAPATRLSPTHGYGYDCYPITHVPPAPQHGTHPPFPNADPERNKYKPLVGQYPGEDSGSVTHARHPNHPTTQHAHAHALAEAEPTTATVTAATDGHYSNFNRMLGGLHRQRRIIPEHSKNSGGHGHGTIPPSHDLPFIHTRPHAPHTDSTSTSTTQFPNNNRSRVHDGYPSRIRTQLPSHSTLY